MSELDRSIDYYRKVCMIHENIVPTQTEVKYRMGDNLANVLFNSILPALKPYLGVCPPLKGPGDDLWLSPSDLLIGKVKLKPPLTSKHIKALTHEGILGIGHIVEQKRDNEHQLEKEKALIEKELIIKYMAAKELREAVARAKEEKDKEQAEVVAKLEEDFKEELKYELQQLSDKLKIEQDIAVEIGKKEKEEEMQVKLDIAVQDTVCRLTEQFARELYKVSKKMHEHFWYHIRKEKKKLKEAIHFERLHGQEKLGQLRAELQCENVANIMYILANERRRCVCEKQAIENNFIARLSVLEKEQEERNEKLVASIKRYEVAGHDIKVREAVLFDIIRQFQKFIYFVLRAVPMQAEYLLNVEQLMIFELTKTALATKPELFEAEIAAEEDTGQEQTENEWKLAVDDGVANTTKTNSFQLLYNGSHIASTKSGRGGNLTEIDASKVDYHNCENISRCDSIDKSLKENEDLPYFLFNENLYVREDFRNMISQGIKISKSHELWSYKNQEVIETIMPDTESDNDNDNNNNNDKSDENMLTIQERISINQALEEKERQSLKKSNINVRFSALNPQTEKIYEDEKVLDTQIYSDITTLDPESNIMQFTPKQKHSLDSTRSLGMDLDPDIQMDMDHKKRPSRLVLARDSVEILVKKSNTVLRKGSKLLALRSRNSFLSQRKKSFEEKSTGTKDMYSRKESKIELHTDSVELLKDKESIHIRNSKDSVPVNCHKDKRNIGIQCDSLHKTVGISHIEIIPDDSKRRVSAVSFRNIPKIIPDKLSETFEEKKEEQGYHRPPTGDRIYRMPEKAFKIIGDKDMNEYLQTQDEFTAKRVTSFIRIFRNDPSLRDLFTEATKN